MLKCVQRSLVTSKKPRFRQQALGQYWTQAMLTGSWTDYLMLEYTNSGKSLEQNVAECEPCTGPRDNPVSSSNHAGICSTKDTSSTQSHDLQKYNSAFCSSGSLNPTLHPFGKVFLIVLTAQVGNGTLMLLPRNPTR
ncbi:hypothetical protein V1264_008074 [Littorina saxatilis]|uniref:Uncharacterized protein n=1 Tax=Littorina saxatilis TaxID=31220 RepID=A0AAN9ASD0_9CAEN